MSIPCRRVYVAAILCAVASTSHAESQDIRRFTFEPRTPKRELSRPNLLSDAEVTASGHWSTQVPQKAIDGDKTRDSHWACEQLPAVLNLDLPEQRVVRQINLWTFWDGQRAYQFKVEGRAKGGDWDILGGKTGLGVPSDEGGFRFVLPEAKNVQQVRVTITDSNRRAAGGHIVEIEAFDSISEDRLQGAAGDLDTRYSGHNVPFENGRKWKATAWRGERVNGQFVLWTDAPVSQVRLLSSDLVSSEGHRISREHVQPRFVRYVLGDGQLLPDVIDPVGELDMGAQSLRPVWLQIDVPQAAAPATYQGTLTANGAGEQAVQFDLELEVLPARLPPPSEWAFHLDLWQHPWAIARYHRVEPWSAEHYAQLRPILTMLADAGQKILTTTITHRPWNQQTFDAYGSMVRRVKQADGTWTFDYSLFDEYVEFGRSCGITKQINCYTLIPWGDTFYYHDGATGDFVQFTAAPGTEAYRDYWAPFLRDFQEHLRMKGWLGKTFIAMDERPAGPMKHAVDLVKAHAPEIPVSLAGNHAPSHYTGLELQEFSIVITHANADLYQQIGGRTGEGKTTTFYVCTNPKRPNTFTFSPPAEAVWLGYYAAAKQYSGLLRWAANHWPLDPLFDTSFGRWPAGDTFLIYPGPRSAIRFERLREGIQEYEKIRLLRAHLAAQGAEGSGALNDLEEALSPFDYSRLGSDDDVIRNVHRAAEVVTRLSRRMGN